MIQTVRWKPFLTVVMMDIWKKRGCEAETSSVDDTSAWDHKRVRSHRATPQQRDRDFPIGICKEYLVDTSC